MPDRSTTGRPAADAPPDVPERPLADPAAFGGLPSFDDDALDAMLGGTAEAEEAVGVLPAEEPQPVDELETGVTLWAMIFAGGIGSRFWPLSTPERPKQLLSLVGEKPLIAETVARLAPTIPPDRVLVLTSADIADALRAAIPEVPDANMLVEPRPMGTAAALAWGAAEVQRRAGPQTAFVAMHADLAVAFPREFRRQLVAAARLVTASRGDGGVRVVMLGAEPTRNETGFGYPAEFRRQLVGAGRLVTASRGDGGVRVVMLGAEPTRNETGFGYALPGEALDVDAGAAEVSADMASELPGGRREAARRVTRFIEKPGPLHAEQLVAEGAFWHTGTLVSTAERAIEALTERTPELELGIAALLAGKMDRFSGLVQSVSIERGLLERLPDLVVLPVDCGWDDVGTWSALRRVRELDDTGNGVWGPAHLVDASSCVVHAEGQTTVVYGMSGVLVVSRPGLTFVTTLDRATELNSLLDALPEGLAGRPRRETL